MDEYEDDFEEEEAEGEEEEEKEEEEEREELSIDEEGEKSLDNSEEEKEEEALEVEESLDEDEKEDMENRVDSKAESDREKGEEDNEESLENVEDKREKIEDNVEKSEGQVKDQIEDFAGKEMVANDLKICDNRDTGAVIDKNLEISCKEDTKVTKAKSEEVDKETHGQSEIKSLNHETDSLINTMEDIKDEPKAESAKSPRRLRSSQTRIENRKADVTNDVKTEKSTNINIKQELPDTCAGLQVSKLELDRIRLKKDLLQSRINTLDKFLDPSIKSKEWRQGEEGEDEKLTEIRKRRPKQRRLTETEVMQRLGTKRKRSEDGVAVEDNVSVVKSDGRGRPKGWRKVKEEVADDSVDKPIVKRRKKEELLLMKALDEEMLKMDEDNTKEMERISQGLDYQCSVCSQVFIEKINLSKHFFKCLMKFTQSGRSSFKCAICFEYFSLLESLEAHVSRKHDGICEEPFQCSVCSLCFEEGCSLKVHVLDKHDVFQCWLCSKYYRNQHTLDIHLAKKHPGESRDRKPIERKGNNTNIPTVTPGNTVITSGNTTNIATTTTGNTVTFTRNTRGKGSVANIIKQEPTEHVKIEPPSTSQPNANEPRKKLGRPFKRNLSEDQYTGTQPVLQKRKLIDNQYTGAQPVLQTEGQVHSKPQLPNSEPTPAAGATTPETGTKTDDKIPPVTPEENGDELGRGRRVKKKKALDYEDSISTTPGRRVNRKSADGGQIGQLTYGTMGSGQTCSSQGTLGGQLVEASCSNGLTIHGSHQMTDLKTNNPNDGRFVRNRNSIRNHQMPQPRILHPQPMPLPRVIQPHSISVQKVNNMRAEKCSKGTNTSSNRESLPVWKVFPSSDLSTSKNNSTSNNASTSETLSQSVADDVSTGDPSEQPIQQAVESSVYLNRKVHLCPKCRKPFPNKYLVKVHMKRRHNIFKRKTVIVPQNGAQESGETPPSGQTSERNQSRSQPLIGNRETLFKCVLCEASFPSFYSLEDHYLRVHEGIPCSVCRIRIKNRMLLDKHLNACHPPEVRYVCPVCDKRMKSKETLRKHIVMHEDRRPYDCSVCKRSFRYSYDMRLHMRRTHPKEFARMNSGNAIVGEEETGGDE
uniref:Zinc finger and BTB domain-containing protein 41 n=1 Tax=Cacopsylla melanoneura TaxID=428564 RepID=A0A8D8Q837_9HEMI